MDMFQTAALMLIPDQQKLGPSGLPGSAAPRHQTALRRARFQEHHPWQRSHQHGEHTPCTLYMATCMFETMMFFGRKYQYYRTYAFVLVHKESLASHRAIPRTVALPSVNAPNASTTLASIPGTIPHQHFIRLVQQQCVVMTLNKKLPQFKFHKTRDRIEQIRYPAYQNSCFFPLFTYS
jgi:hypothetical protein